MPIDVAEIARRFPRSARYDDTLRRIPAMGPSVLWLTESLAEVLPLERGMRVLDLGCGRATSSMFLAKEFGVRVWAADLWIKPTENYRRIKEFGLEAEVFPILAEAHALPFADDYFDAVISTDAYHYFGTDALYLGYLERFIRPGGLLGIAVPGLREEFRDGLPAHLAPYWDRDFWSFHSADWWKAHWEHTGTFEVLHASFLADGGALWLAWLEMPSEGVEAPPSEVAMLREDAGRNLGFTIVAARRKG
jgi:SAM-dependent methyltransferase